MQEHFTSQIVPLVPVFSSYEKSFKQFAWQHRLLLEPSQLKGEILNLLLAFRNSQQEEVIDKYPLHVLHRNPYIFIRSIHRAISTTGASFY